MNKTRSEPDLRLLIFGALAGLLAAGFGVLRQTPSPDALPAGAVARVNETLISQDRYASAAARANSTANTPGDAALLAQLVDEELLVQRGVALGMTQSDLTVRQAVIDSLIASVTAEADAASPSDDELQQYLASNAERFSYTAKIWIDAWLTDKEAVAQTLAESLRAGDAIELGDDIDPMRDLPAGLLAMDIAVNYIGRGVAAAVATMPEGSSAVFARRGRWLIVRLREKETSTITDLEAIRNRVLIDYRRNLADMTLETYLDGLRQQAEIVMPSQ